MLTSSVRPGTVCDVMEGLLDMGDTGIMVTRAIALTLAYCTKVFRRRATVLQKGSPQLEMKGKCCPRDDFGLWGT